MEDRQETKRQKTLERELEWVHMAPKARHAKSKARLSAYDKLLNEETKDKEGRLELFIPAGPRLGDVVIEAKNVSKAYGDKLLFDDLNFSLPKAGIVGVIGLTALELVVYFVIFRQDIHYMLNTLLHNLFLQFLSGCS